MTADKVARDVAVQRERHLIQWGEQGQHHRDGTGPDASWATVGPAGEVARRAIEKTRRAFAEGVGTWRDILFEELAEAFAQGDPAALRPRLIRVAAVAQDWAADIDSRRQLAADIAELVMTKPTARALDACLVRFERRGSEIWANFFDIDRDQTGVTRHPGDWSTAELVAHYESRGWTVVETAPRGFKVGDPVEITARSDEDERTPPGARLIGKTGYVSEIDDNPEHSIGLTVEGWLGPVWCNSGEVRHLRSPGCAAHETAGAR